MASPGVGRSLASRRGFGVCVVAAAVLSAAVLGLMGLDNRLFWDDEANTAIYGRNLLKFGRLTAWDERNLVGYAFGGSLGEDLGKELRVPGLPACAAAFGMLLFGESTFGGRVMFVAAGLVSVVLLAIWMRKLLGRRFPWYLPSLLLAVCPAYLLYIRNCRYYALGVTFTLLLWIFWTPSPGKQRPSCTAALDRRWLPGYVGATAALLLLLCTHYLNAAAAMATLPVFFLQRRFRGRRQYLLLGILCTAALLFGIWISLAANPFAADYSRPPDSALGVQPWAHFYTNFGKLVRDLGTHEFFPWCVVPTLLVPWSATQTRRLRPWAARGGVLTAAVLAYLVTAAALTPSDMGQGPVAEMRYVVPLVAVGCAVGGLTVGLLWRISRPLAAAVLLLLIGTNLLHMGFLAKRDDLANPSWPPTLYRYVADALSDYPTGTEAMVELLGDLPEGTTVRTWPAHLVYPAMFYLPKLHYCDQLTESKPIRADLGRLPDYLFVELSRAEVIVVAIPELRQKLAELYFRLGPDSHELKRVLAPYFNYTTKPEIPARHFSAEPDDWVRFPGIAVLVRSGSPLAELPALRVDPTDADEICRMGKALLDSGDLPAASARLDQALRVDPHHPQANLYLGRLSMEQAENSKAIRHLEAAIRADPENWGAHLNLGIVLARLRRIEPARRQFHEALRLKPDEAVAHYNLGNLAQSQPGGYDQAIAHYEAALRLRPQYAAAHANWATALYRRGQTEEAVEHYRHALRIQPNMVDTQVNLGVALEALGRKEEGIAEVRKALKMVRSDSVRADRIRDLLLRLGAP